MQLWVLARGCIPAAACETGVLMPMQEAPRARDVFLLWEKWLRPSYNVLLALACIAVAALLATPEQPVPLNGASAFHLISRAVIANILFTAGPLADLYLSVLFRKRSPVVTGVIFAVGALASLAIVPISLDWFWSTQYPGGSFFAGFD